MPTRTGSSLPSRAASHLLPRRCSPVSPTRRNCRRICRAATSISATASPAARAAEMEVAALRSEEHTSELQSRQYLVCRLLLEKKKKQKIADLIGEIENKEVRT